MAKRKIKNKVRVEITHPDFQADCILTQSKAFTYLKRIKKTFKDNLKVVTTVLTPEALAKLKLNLDRPAPRRIGSLERLMNAEAELVDLERKALAS